MNALLPNPLPENRDRAPELLAALWTPIPILTAVLAARFYVRFRMRNVGLDDWMMLLAFVVFVISNVLGTLFANYGGGRHIYYIQPVDQLVKVLHIAYVAQPFGAVAGALGKASVAGLTLRIAGPNTFWRKWFLYVSIFILFALTVTDITLKYVQCTPVNANWDIRIPPTQKHCWNPHIAPNVSIANSSWGTFMDFVLAFLPCTIIWNLKLDLKTKISLAGFLGVGLFAGICAAVKTNQLYTIGNRSDFTWAVFDLYIWTEVEISLVIFCGCIPPIKPLFDRLFQGKPIGGSSKGYGGGTYGKGYRLGSSPFSGKGTNSAESTRMSKTLVASRMGDEDEKGLWAKRHDGQIVVSHQYDVETRSAPSTPSGDEVV